ncbi:hypothetical protein I6F36_24150 [Bradyrhizobium sp. BRP19]|uniref:hypothetical protein n=1 Tax=Bradyrhizobium sp. BRP19 TaxID=2793823 RepID=UPI001CD58752|nr:hypothetical protein [Bradyrhizobium sp. BRP19]MCA1549928.1 hypothetical protein [Bradyrhizobium sp. BRP19]
MGRHFSGIKGFAPVQVLNAPPSNIVSIGQLLSTTEMELVQRYASPLNEQCPRMPEQPPRDLIPANVLKVDRGEIDWVEAITRLLVWQGHPIAQARSLADVSVALSELHSNRRGRKRQPPHLYPRGKFIWMTDGKERKTTGYLVDEVKDYRKHLGANAKLSVMVEKRVRQILGRVLKRDVSISTMFASWLLHNKPGLRPDSLSSERFDAIANELQHLEEFMGNNTMAELGWSTGVQYLEWASARQIKSQSAQDDPREIRYIARTTARNHVQTLIMVERWYCEQNNIDSTKIKVPHVRRPAVAHLSFAEIIRLISAARGRVYNETGEIIGHHGKRGRYECIIRFIIIYLYGGTRHANILLLTWFQDLMLGHINPELGIIERQGARADRTCKDKGTSWLIGSLSELAARWHAEDELMRQRYPGRYVHIIHDEEGFPIANVDAKSSKEVGKRMAVLFQEVRELAGLPHARPHMLKHSGVTFAVRAGMSVGEVSQAFSTSPMTLWTYYVHLRPWLTSVRSYDPARLKLLALRRLSSPMATVRPLASDVCASQPEPMRLCPPMANRSHA